MIEVKTGAFKVSENLFGKTALPSLAACYACLTAKLDTHFSLSLSLALHGVAGSEFGNERGQTAVVAPRSQQLFLQRGRKLEQATCPRPLCGLSWFYVVSFPFYFFVLYSKSDSILKVQTVEIHCI